MHTYSPSVARQPLKVALVGVGGTGSAVLTHLTHLHQALVALGKPGLAVVAFDPDVVSPANLVRQRYYHTDLGRNKAQVLIGRINLACSLNWQAIPLKFNGDRARRSWDLVISCVDTRQARYELHAAAHSTSFGVKWTYWLDCGNDLTTGQVILGTPKSSGANALPCATDLHPELMDLSIPEDETPSCSAMEALSRQDLFIGAMVAVQAVDLLWQLLRHGQLTQHARYFNLAGAQLAGKDCPTAQKKPRKSKKTAAAA